MVQIRDYKTDTYIAYVKDNKNYENVGRGYNDCKIWSFSWKNFWGIEVYNVALAKVIPYDKAY